MDNMQNISQLEQIRLQAIDLLNNSKNGELAKMARAGVASPQWLSEFKRGNIKNPTFDSVQGVLDWFSRESAA